MPSVLPYNSFHKHCTTKNFYKIFCLENASRVTYNKTNRSISNFRDIHHPINLSGGDDGMSSILFLLSSFLKEVSLKKDVIHFLSFFFFDSRSHVFLFLLHPVYAYIYT